MKSIWDNLLVRVSFVSLVVLAAVAVGIALFVSARIKSDAIDAVVDQAVLDTQVIARGVLKPTDFEEPMTGERLAEFDGWVRSTLLTDVTAMLKVWGANSTLVYSSDPTDAEDPENGPDLPAALNKERSAHISPANGPHPGAFRGHDLIEVYVPFVLPGSTKVLGATEIYQFYEPTAQRIRDMRNWVFLITGSGFLFLFCTLFAIYWGTSGIIKRQRAALAGANADLQAASDELELRVEARTAENSRLYESLQQAHAELESRVEARTAENAKLNEELQASTREQVVVDEVARIVTSTLHIDQVYEKFATEVKKLVDFDRMTINVVDDEPGSYIPKYRSGVYMEGREDHSRVPLEGTIVERVLRTGLPFLREDVRTGEGLLHDATRLKAGLQSHVTVPLFSKTQTMGAITFHSCRVKAYGLKEQAILERLADQIAPALENARLYEELQASTREKAVVDEVARIVTSTLDIDQVYEKFAEEMKKLVDFDRVTINILDDDPTSYLPKYRSGVRLEERQDLSRVPITGTMVGHVRQTGLPLLREDIRSGDSFPRDPARLESGLLSNITVPLLSKTRIGGTLTLQSYRVRSYGRKEQAILERLAYQIAPAVENARLYDELQASTREKAVVDEVARIVTSTLDIDQVYEKFAKEIMKLVEYDRMTIAVIDEVPGSYLPKYQFGLHLEGRDPRSRMPLEGTIVERALRTGLPSFRENILAGDILLHDAARYKSLCQKCRKPADLKYDSPVSKFAKLEV